MPGIQQQKYNIVGGLADLRLLRSCHTGLTDHKSRREADSIKEGGKQVVIPSNSSGNPMTGFSNNWWTGIEMLHTLFAMEHNAIYNTVRAAHPDWTG